ncbi:MAG: pilus assembly protein TadG-related protein [Mycobacterium sp.]
MILAISVAVILAATAVVLDGGKAMAQQRGAQNATDSAALAGAVVIGQNFAACQTLPCNSRSDGDVLNAVSNAFTNNSTTMGTIHYVDFTLNQVGTVCGGGSIPSAASGVEANGTRLFNTFLASLIGQPTWTAGANATALAGEWLGGCSAAEGCGTLPVVFSIPIITCDGTNRPLRVGGVYTSIGDPLLATAANESIVPLCKTGPGGVGWIDMPGCTGNLSNQIWPPCSAGFRLPTWLHTSSGNPNNVENVINTHYAGTIVLIPMFDSTCRDIPSTGLPADCTDPGNGNNLYYHIPQVAPFLLDHAYIQGNNHPQCDSDPGGPHVGGNGSTSCFKGWFVNEMLHGEVGAFTPCNTTDDTTTCAPPIIGTQLVQ